MTPLITTHEPPSKQFFVYELKMSGRLPWFRLQGIVFETL